ncbi:MAG TPA: HIT domain-containing protein [Candidatus Saccharimonadales bacterium]|nr:HIT domain-containing protein [Candidatus Saccharimonadales bacterium]
MTAPRNRKQVKAYDKHLAEVEPPSKGCSFCAINKGSPQFVTETKSFKVIRNIFPYSLWDSQPVKDHLMLIPKRHTDTLADLTPAAAQEFVKLLSSYESKGYSVYARAPGSVIKTVLHQHTHLIKHGDKVIKGLLYLRKPYVRLVIQ